MITCKILIKIKDYYPKIDSIPYENYICLFTCGEYEGQIPFLPDDSQIIQHQIKNINSDIKYKVHILDYNDMSLIGMCEMTISYQIINQISPPNGFIQEQQKKLLIDLKTKRKLFGTIVNIGDIYLNIFAEVFLVSRSSLEQKSANKIKKNLYANTPQCYIKYNFQLNKSDYSPKSSKNKSSLINSNSEKHTLNSMKQDKFFTNKHSNHNLINYKINKDNQDKDIDDNKKTYSSFTNNIKKGFNNYSSRMQQKKYPNNNDIKEQNKRTIMDLLQQRKMFEKNIDKDNSVKENKSDNDEKVNNIDNDDNNNLIQKEGYLTEQNFNLNKGKNLGSKYIINNHKLKKQNTEDLKIYNNNNNNKLGKDIFKKDEYENKERYDNKSDIVIFNKNVKNDISDNIYAKNSLSPNVNNINKNDLNKASKNNGPNNLDNNYVYKSKNKMIKMGKAFSKNKFNINKKYNNNNQENKLNNNIDKNNILNTNKNENYRNNINTTSLSTYSGDDDYLDIDRIILEKGADLRNDFQMQLKQNPYQKNINNIRFKKKSNKEYDNNNYQKKDNNNGIIGGTQFNMDTPRTEKISQYSSTQSLNNTLTQENIKNNCLKLIEFYSLLNYKLKKINPKNIEIQKKLLIIKELFSNELKKSNLITNQSNLNQFEYNLSTNINGPLNEKILYLFPKIKKIESIIYQCLFDIYYTDEEIIKFKQDENFDEQTKIYLLLTVVKNLINKYGNISQIFETEIIKKNMLKQCLLNYELIEKEEGDKDFVNLEELTHEIKLKSKNDIKDYNEDINNKFKVIKEVDEDKEEENDEDEEEEIKENNQEEISQNNTHEMQKEINQNNINNNQIQENIINNSHQKIEEINENDNNDIDLNDANDEEIIEKILIDDFRKKHKDNKYFFEKIGLYEYIYHNIKINAIIDKDGEIKLIVDDNKKEYYLDDFVKIFNEEKNINNNENNSNEEINDEEEKSKNSKDEENIDIGLNIENKDANENVNNLSDISNEHHKISNDKEEEEEDENNADYSDNNENENENENKNNENGMN